jgi:flavin-dependent dehydrogenase
MWDAIVAGGGPAGAVAAIVLARSGRRVLLADAVDASTPKVGEALPGAAVQLLRSSDLPVPREGGPHTPIGGNLFCWNSDELVAIDFIRSPYGSGWRLDRARFDADLREAAIRDGATYRSERIAGVERTDTSWNIRLRNGATEKARWIIDATGRRAAIARRLGARRLRDAQLVALYAIGGYAARFPLSRTVIEATQRGWWYSARLPSDVVLAGFHTLQRDAVHLLSNPGIWRDALAQTRHLGEMLAGTQFEHPPQSLEACGARLDRCTGDGWIACGDAALSFDPISGQGIFSALYGGLTAARAIDEALNGSDTKLREYSKWLNDIRRIYVARCRAVYCGERRWMSEPFWTILAGEVLELSRGFTALEPDPKDCCARAGRAPGGAKEPYRRAAYRDRLA